MEHTELEFDFNPDEFRVNLLKDSDIDCDGMCCSDCTVSSCTMHPNNLK